MTLTLKEIAELVGGSIEGDFSKSIQGIGTLDSAISLSINVITTVFQFFL